MAVAGVTYMVDLWRRKVLTPPAQSPLDNIIRSPPPVIIFDSVEILLAHGKIFDGGETLDPIAAGHGSVNC